MGFLDSMASAMITRVAGAERGPVVKAALDLFNRHGGANGIMDKFRAKGFGKQVDSWIGDGPNLPISPKQVEAVLGECILDEIAVQLKASNLDYTHKDLSKKLAEHLPRIIDQLSPQGELPTSNAELLLKAAAIYKNY